MTRYLLSHGHLVLDGKREYLDGAVLFEGNRLLQVFPHSNHIQASDYEEINLRHQLVFPCFNRKIQKGNMVFCDPEKTDLEELHKLLESDKFIVVKDSNTDLCELALKNIPRHKAILASSNIYTTMKKLHEKGVSYSDLSLMTYANLERSQGNSYVVVKGNPVNFVIVDKDFNPIFRILNGEFIYA